MQVQLFAALRDAAGVSVVEVEATTVGELVDELGRRFGEVMQRRLTMATVFVDDVPVTSAARDRDLSGADQVVVVPPFAGG